jgi:hypothetical protein
MVVGTSWLADDRLGRPPLGPVAGVGPVGVGEPDVGLELSTEAGLLGDQEPGEGRLLVLVQGGQLHALDAAVGLGTTGLDAAVLGRELLGHGADEGPSTRIQNR